MIRKKPQKFMVIKKQTDGSPFKVSYISVIGFNLPCIIFSPSKKASCIYYQHEIDMIIPILKKMNIDFTVVKYHHA